MLLDEAVAIRDGFSSAKFVVHRCHQAVVV